MMTLFLLMAFAHHAGVSTTETEVAESVPRVVWQEDATRVRKDIVYAEREGFADRFTSLDVYRPSAKAERSDARPILVFVHGGAWVFGDKRSVNMLPQWCEREGWILVSLNYRLSPKVIHPEHARDVAAGLAWVFDHAGDIGGDPERVVLMGHSAGAHMAAIVATDPDLLGEVDHVPTDLVGVVLLDGGAYDIAAQLGSKWLGGTRRKMLEEAFGTDNQVWVEASPMIQAKSAKALPPVLAVYAGDRVRSRIESKKLVEIWKSRAPRAMSHHAPDKNHAGINRLLGTPGDPDTEAVEKFVKWAFAKE
jgi:arylformamidase